jgi:hypothetical protein
MPESGPRCGMENSLIYRGFSNPLQGDPAPFDYAFGSAQGKEKEVARHLSEKAMRDISSP